MRGLYQLRLWKMLCFGTSRDISNSSVERIIIPDSTILLDYMLNRFTGIVKDLFVYPKIWHKILVALVASFFPSRFCLNLWKKD